MICMQAKKSETCIALYEAYKQKKTNNPYNKPLRLLACVYCTDSQGNLGTDRNA
jgi:hypothetical protein